MLTRLVQRFPRVNPALSCTESHTETAKALLFASVAKFRGGAGGQSDGAKIAVEREEDLGPHLRGEAGCHPHYALQGLLEHASTILSPNARRPPSTSRVTAELAQYARAHSYTAYPPYSYRHNIATVGKARSGAPLHTVMRTRQLEHARSLRTPLALWVAARL